MSHKDAFAREYDFVASDLLFGPLPMNVACTAIIQYAN
jgi:hypothetical protein